MTGPLRTQGSLVSDDDPFALKADEQIRHLGFRSENAHRWIVASHECCFESEVATSLELMWVEFREEQPGIKIQTGHSARRLAFLHGNTWAYVRGDMRVVLKANDGQRKRIRLEPFLTDEQTERFKRWLGHRYSRPALPGRISDFLSQRGITDGMSDLLDELPETAQVLITGHEAIDPKEPIIGIRLAILLEPGTPLGPPHDMRRAAWRDKVMALNWVDEATEGSGVALDGLVFLPAENLLYADFLKYGVMDFDHVSNRHDMFLSSDYDL